MSAEALADYLVSGFEGAMSRARLVRDRQPLDGFLDVTFATVLARPMRLRARRAVSGRGSRACG